jgi:hypothetical protein
MDGWNVEQSSKQANYHHEGSQRLKVGSETLQQRIPTLVNEKR